jgi:TRAP-type C4-dicarboxylate transport system permease small subunit
VLAALGRVVARLGRVDAVIQRAARTGSFLAGVAVLLITALITYDVLMRYILGEPQLFVDELVGFLQVFVIFAALAGAFRRGAHIRVDLITSRLPGAARAWLRVATLLVALGLLGVVSWVTIGSAITAYRFERVSTVMLYPIWIPMALIPAGLALLAVTMLIALGRQLRAALRPPGERDEVRSEDVTGE